MNPVIATFITCGVIATVTIAILLFAVTAFPAIWGRFAAWIDRRMVDTITKHADGERAQRWAAIDAEYRALVLDETRND